MYVFSYARDAAVNYAHEWAFSRNPHYANFDGMGGDCTNFVSQCLFAGCNVMNLREWFFHNLNWRSPSWSGVEFLYDYLIGNDKGIGPFGVETTIDGIQLGDIVQIKFNNDVFSHAVFVVSVGNPATIDTVLISAHSEDSNDRPLSTYIYDDIRFIHILGVRVE